MRRFVWILMAAPMILALACDGGGMKVLDGHGQMGQADFSIVNGSAPDAAHHDAVVSLHELTRDGTSVYVSPFCSGTLVTDDVVVTAAHCLNTGRASKVRTMSPSLLAIYVGDEPALDIVDHLYLVSETEIHPSYDPIALENDIALVRLSSPITEAVTPVPHLPAASGFSNGDIGADLNFAGFGQDENGNSGVKLQGDWPLGGLGCSVAYCPGAGDTATQISYEQANGGPCFGDSGGPAFIDRAGTTYLGGITSYGDSYCLYYGVSTRVDAYETYIDDFIGAGGGSCGDGICGAGESCDGRSGTTACGDCAGVTSGKPSNRYCYVEGACEGSGCP